jgi:CRP/FNR family transcriptional regulator, cyclic AMP receptor protein
MVSSDRRTELLGAVELFAGIDPADLEAIAARATEVEFPAGRPIARQGEVGTGFFVVESGRARVVRDGETLAELGPGGFFGELSLLDGGPRIASVVAEEPTRCLALPSWEFERLLEERPRIAILILKGVARRLRAVTTSHHH